MVDDYDISVQQSTFVSNFARILLENRQNMFLRYLLNVFYKLTLEGQEKKEITSFWKKFWRWSTKLKRKCFVYKDDNQREGDWQIETSQSQIRISSREF